MSPLLRAALAWILALALPMQGLAAATMLHCGPGPGSHAAVAPQAHTGHAAAAAHEQGADHPHGGHHGGDAAADDAHQCSACAACVAGPALPSSVTSSPPLEPAGATPVPPLLRKSSVVAARLERPPQPTLA